MTILSKILVTLVAIEFFYIIPVVLVNFFLEENV